MLRVLSDIFKALDRGDLVALTLLDLSAAFDKVDHATLIRRLEISYGINCVDLRWLSPYLQLRVQHVRCSGSRSTPSVLLCGVPPGSVLGPITFLLYIADLIQLIEKTGLYPHLYADDTQIYGFYPRSAPKSYLFKRPHASATYPGARPKGGLGGG